MKDSKKFDLVPWDNYGTEVQKIGIELFNKITSLPEDVRPNSAKKRTGIRILCREPESRNFIIITARDPSKATNLFVYEKAVRSWVNKVPTSGTNANPEKFEFAGSITHKLDNMYLQVSVSGLSAEEDEICAIIIMHRIFGVSIAEIFKYIDENNGETSKAFQESGKYIYLWNLLKEYDLNN